MTEKETGRKYPESFPKIASNEDGQSIVLITLVFVGLLAFTALAVDAGLAFVRSSQFSAAVDAAALAGVIDLDPSSNNTAEARNRAEQFLSANGWPTRTLTIFKDDRSFTESGIPQYSITVTWPVEFNFAKIIGLEKLVITHPASAAYFSQAELYVPTANDDGRIREASQYLVGKDGCSVAGDPVVPLRASANPDMPNLNHSNFNGTYRYRIRIPESYTGTNSLRVELFDPDSQNLSYDLAHPNDAVITHTQAASNTFGLSENLSCNSQGPGDSCVIRTGERLDGAFLNPFWFLRVDETWNANCEVDYNNPLGDTVTTYELYYLDDNDDRKPLAEYTVDNGDSALTDLQWVVPGVTPGVDATLNNFDIDLTNVPVSSVHGYRLVYMDVTSDGGSAKNVWDVRAGPVPSLYVTTTVPILENDVNLRNLQMANMPSAYFTQGIYVEALGRMPTQYHVDNESIKTSLTPVDISLGASTMYVRHFDYDISAPPPMITFTIDTVPIDPNNPGTPTPFFVRAAIVENDPNPAAFQASCDNGIDCNNSWSYPQYMIGIPSSVWAGGTLEATFTPFGNGFVWSTSVTSGRPILTK
jgi:hypothetical protein